LEKKLDEKWALEKAKIDAADAKKKAEKDA